MENWFFIDNSHLIDTQVEYQLYIYYELYTGRILALNVCHSTFTLCEIDSMLSYILHTVHVVTVASRMHALFKLSLAYHPDRMPTIFTYRVHIKYDTNETLFLSEYWMRLTFSSIVQHKKFGFIWNFQSKLSISFNQYFYQMFTQFLIKLSQKFSHNLLKNITNTIEKMMMARPTFFSFLIWLLLFSSVLMKKKKTSTSIYYQWKSQNESIKWSLYGMKREKTNNRQHAQLCM